MGLGRAAQSLSGKGAIVTGAGQGIGLTIAETYLQAGANVALIDRDGDRLRAAEQELRGQGLNPLTIAGDIRDIEQVDGAISRVAEEFGSIDILVNNAALLMTFVKGDAPDRPRFWEIDPSRWQELWDVNVGGTWICCRRVAPLMIKAGRGSIINVTTSYHTTRSEAHIPYGPSKAALEAFTAAAAKQLRPYGVRANALLPGRAVNARGESHPHLAPPDTIAPAALFLASDDSVRITGQSIIADEFNRERGLLPSGSFRAD
jgi:NAD(P)-dependent dehydrogenase (short-subunit alcohol dehydrogenase family)